MKIGYFLAATALVVIVLTALYQPLRPAPNPVAQAIPAATTPKRDISPCDLVPTNPEKVIRHKNGTLTFISRGINITCPSDKKVPASIVVEEEK